MWATKYLLQYLRSTQVVPVQSVQCVTLRIEFDLPPLCGLTTDSLWAGYPTWALLGAWVCLKYAL